MTRYTKICIWLLIIFVSIAGFGFSVIRYAKYSTEKELRRHFTFDDIRLEVRISDIRMDANHVVILNFLIYGKNFRNICKPNEPFKDGVISYQPWFMFR
jgi:hypothetical protein